MQDLTVKEFNKLRDFIKGNYGINLNDEKRSLIFSRLSPVLKQKKLGNFTEYYDYLVRDTTGEAIVTFIDRITTNHTYFMREPDHFYFFKDKVLPDIEARHPNKDLRVWCAGCSSGEEAYTLQMIIKIHFSGKRGWNTEILATDISTAVLTKAVRGVYSGESVKPLPEDWKRRFFRQNDGSCVAVSEELKRDVTFRRFNFMDKFPFSTKFQAIFCRNVMIYFDNETRNGLVRKFYDALEPGGYLFVGHSESLGQCGVNLKYLAPAVYMK
jgi:chemotaxis protein methyltransferase CheR